MSDEASRVKFILETARYCALAVNTPRLWVATVNFVLWRQDPASILFYSARGSQHAQAVLSNQDVAGACWVTDAPTRELDGLQFTGQCFEIDPHELASAHEFYYANNFTPDERKEWELPLHSFNSGGKHAFFSCQITELWIVDDRRWDEDKIDRRMQVSTRL